MPGTPRVVRDEQLVLSVPEAAQRVRVGRDFMYAEVAAGRIGHIRVGRRILIPASEVNTWLVRRVAETSDTLTEDGGLGT